MKPLIDLDNNYFLKVLNNINDFPNNIINIENLKLINTLKKDSLLLKIDFNTINKKNFKKILKKLLYIKTLMSKNKIGIEENSKIMLGYIINYDENNKNQNDFISAVNAIFYKSRYERYNYIYDTACNYLDNFFYGKNLCDFKNNKCGEKRSTSSITGCCHHFKPKWLGPLSPKMILCEYLNKVNFTCDAKCLPCKLFTCDYLEKKGVKFKIRDILLLDIFFNPFQKYFIKYKVFTPKDKILKILMIL